MYAAHSVALFVFLSIITPGPNNLMIMSSAMNFGVVRSMPHFWGIVLGFPVMLIAIGLGLGQVFEVFPLANTVLQLVCGVMIVWLAWKIANYNPMSGSEAEQAKPITFLQAAAFQWVNPKAWFMGTALVSLFPPRAEYLVQDVFRLTAINVSVGVFCVAAWMLLGLPLRRWLSNANRVRAFNGTMAAGLVGFYVFSALGSL